MPSQSEFGWAACIVGFRQLRLSHASMSCGSFCVDAAGMHVLYGAVVSEVKMEMHGGSDCFSSEVSFQSAFMLLAYHACSYQAHKQKAQVTWHVPWCDAWHV